MSQRLEFWVELSVNRPDERVNSLPGYSWAATLFTRGCACVCVYVCAWPKSVNIHACVSAFGLRACVHVRCTICIAMCSCAPLEPKTQNSAVTKTTPHTPTTWSTHTHTQSGITLRSYDAVDLEGTDGLDEVCMCAQGEDSNTERKADGESAFFHGEVQKCSVSLAEDNSSLIWSNLVVDCLIVQTDFRNSCMQMHTKWAVCQQHLQGRNLRGCLS